MFAEPLQERAVNVDNGSTQAPTQAVTQGGGGTQAPAYRPEKLVRTDAKSQSLDAFLSNPYAAPKAAALAGVPCVFVCVHDYMCVCVTAWVGRRSA